MADEVSHLIYAVGDVHGSYELVRRAVDRVAEHARGRAHDLVFLGDYIDRGPDTRRTVEFLRTLSRAEPLVCLMGNHEKMLHRFEMAGSHKAFAFWQEYGGDATLRSYGAVSGVEFQLDLIPLEHRLWLYSRPGFLEGEAHVFVHAGIDPKKLMHEQDPADLLWIRERFLRAPPQAFAERRHVVHGHTSQWNGKPDPAVPELLSHRTNLDTGAYRTGVLTVGVFVSGERGGPVDLLSIL